MTQITEFGTVAYQGKTLKLTQEAYASGTNEYPFYESKAVDTDGKEYFVRWETTDEWDSQQAMFRNSQEIENEIQEDCACDWDKPSQIWPM